MMKTLGDFLTEREHKLLNGVAEEKRAFLLLALDENNEWSWAYRNLDPHAGMSDPLSLETDLREYLGSFDDRNLSLYHSNFRKIRRFVLTRYAFGLLWRVYKVWKVPGRRWRWVLDYAMLRFPLSMLLAYGSILGAGDLREWIGELSCKFPWVFVSLCNLIFIWLLWLNIHDKLGRGEHGMARLFARTSIVVLPLMSWSAGLNCLVWWLGCAMGKTALNGPFDCKLVGVTAVAALFSIIGQYVFSGGKSIAEPL